MSDISDKFLSEIRLLDQVHITHKVSPLIRWLTSRGRVSISLGYVVGLDMQFVILNRDEGKYHPQEQIMLSKITSYEIIKKGCYSSVSENAEIQVKN